MGRSIHRREFLARTALALAAPSVVPAAILGRGGATPPSEKVVIGAIGQGSRGQHVLGYFIQEEEVRCVAVCDCFPERRTSGKALVDSHYGDTDCAALALHEEVLDRTDIDAVLIATGDRWHTPLSILAARAGKDVYCEKPFSMTVSE